MKNELRGFSKIFSFTLKNQMGKKGYKVTTIVVALLFLLLPALIMTGIEYFDQPEKGGIAETQQNVPEAGQEAMDLSSLKNIYVVDQSEEGILTTEGFAGFDYEAVTGTDLSHVNFQDYAADLAGANTAATGSGDTLILLIDQQGMEYQLHLLIPENSTLPESIAEYAEGLLSTYANGVISQINGSVDILENDSADAEDNVSPMDSAKQILGMLIPYVNIMVLYFFVLFYGQGVSQSVIMEKSSKLMDVFLVSVKPAAMILGKVTAICFAGVLQMTIWICSLIGGFALGVLGATTINSQTDMLLITLIRSFGNMTSGMFSVGGILVTILIILAGLLLYCALAGIGGAIAGKPEDLSSTNITFTLILIGSFFAVLMAGGLDGLESGAVWMDWVPFTSVMVTPSRVLLGSVSVWKGLGCFAVIVVTAIFFTLLAGKMYKVMALYKGDLPNGKQIAEMIRQKNA